MSSRYGPRVTIEYGVLPGLEVIATDELTELFGPGIRVTTPRAGTLVAIHAQPRDALRARTTGVAYLRRQFDIPRPRALLGDVHLAEVLAQIRTVRRLHSRDAFTSLRISAAGADSAVFQRLAIVLADETGLRNSPVDGDLVIRVLPARDSGWYVAVRLTPRPLSARAWHQAGFKGALESTLAAAMVRLTRPQPDDSFVDLCCGSGTILAERLLFKPAGSAAGIDIDPRAMAAAHANLRAAKVDRAACLVAADATTLPLASASVTAMCCNPPWGHQMGGHRANSALYPALLVEAARVCAKGAHFALVSHEVRLIERLLDVDKNWRVVQTVRVSLRGHHPRVWTLTRC